MIQPLSYVHPNAKIADNVDIPQILYNVPSRTACDLLPSSVEILSSHENIIGCIVNAKIINYSY